MLAQASRHAGRALRAATQRRWLASSSLALLLIALVGGQIAIGSGWCRVDPIVEINGEEIQVWVAVPNGAEDAVNGPIEVEFTAPAGATTEVTFVDSGFNGYGETVTFAPGATVNSDGSMNIQITVHVPMDTSSMTSSDAVPVQLEIITSDGSRFVTGNHVQTQTTVTVGG